MKKLNRFGNIFQVQIFGASHGEEVGVLLDGVPAGISLSVEDFKNDIDRRRPIGKAGTPRSEADIPQIKSGLFNGYTTGAPLLISFLNSNTRSNDYSNLLDIPRPSHADFVANAKYHGFQDYRGGGTFSGRLTVGLVAAGVVANKIFPIEIKSEITSLNGCYDKDKFEQIISDARASLDSVGGTIKITINNLPIGLGEPYFDSLESMLAHALFSVPAIKGVSFGSGFEGCALKGSEYNDLIVDKKGTTKTNNNGGINGGISNGNPIIINIAVKPTPSISINQETFNFKENRLDNLVIKGRHDAAIIMRASVVLEAMCKITLADLYLRSKIYD